MLHFHKTNEFIGILFVFVLFCHQWCRTFPCFSWSLVDVLTRIVLTGNYKTKIFSHFPFSCFSVIKCLTWSHNDICKYQKINIQLYFTIYIIFNDKIAPDQCWYIIPYRLYDVTGSINLIMDYAFCLLHIEEFWKMAVPIIWCYRQLQSSNSTLRYTIF